MVKQTGEGVEWSLLEVASKGQTKIIGQQQAAKAEVSLSFREMQGGMINMEVLWPRASI